MIRLIEPTIHMDGRGCFIETWRAEDFDGKFVQQNLSRSKPWVMRGLHYRAMAQQAKLMRCVVGSAAVVGVDLRTGEHKLVHLSEQNERSVFVPPGHAAGFLALGTGAVISYLMTAYHDPKDDHAIDALDADLMIAWPKGPYARSQRDKGAPKLRDVPAKDLPK